MVGVTWPSLLLSAGVGGKNKTSKTKTSNNSTRARSAARAYFFPLVPAQREGPSLVFRMYYTLSFSIDGQLYIFLYSHLDPITFFYLLNKAKKKQKKEVTTTNCTRVKCVCSFISNNPLLMNVWIAAASHLFWFRWLKSFASVERMIGLMMMINWSRSRTDIVRSFTVSIRDNQNISRDTSRFHTPKYLEPN